MPPRNYYDTQHTDTSGKHGWALQVSNWIRQGPSVSVLLQDIQRMNKHTRDVETNKSDRQEVHFGMGFRSTAADFRFRAAPLYQPDAGGPPPYDGEGRVICETTTPGLDMDVLGLETPSHSKHLQGPEYFFFVLPCFRIFRE